jgi:hypothetical protein
MLTLMFLLLTADAREPVDVGLEEVPEQPRRILPGVSRREREAQFMEGAIRPQVLVPVGWERGKRPRVGGRFYDEQGRVFRPEEALRLISSRCPTEMIAVNRHHQVAKLWTSVTGVGVYVFGPSSLFFLIGTAVENDKANVVLEPALRAFNRGDCA